MYLLKKLFQFRDHSSPDAEKPFLEHLEDLRIMITKVVLTLVIAMVVCFTFQDKLMDVLRRPVDKVWETQSLAKLPQTKDGGTRPLNVDLWERAKAVDRAVVGLDAGQRDAFFRALGDDTLRFHAQSVGLLRASLALPAGAKRDAFIANLAGPEELKKQVLTLLKTAPSPEVDNRGNLRMMSALKPTETFMLSMKLAFFAGIVVSFPLLLMFILQFVLPGMHTNEKSVLWPALAIGFGLFLGGVLFAYFFVLPRALEFFSDWGNQLGVANDWRIGEYISFATQFTLLFGLSFEVPVVVMVLVKLGLLTYDSMSRTRSYAIVAIVIAAAILTPTPDIFTLGLMALPMIFLYEICIWLAWFEARKNRRAEAAEKEARAAHLLAYPPAPEPEPEITAETGDDGWQTEYPDLSPTDPTDPSPAPPHEPPHPIP